MPFARLSTPTVKDLFVRQIEHMILSGELAPGERLPSERELAERVGASKTAVHDGIADMVRKGFLDVVPRKGIFVGDYARNGTLETLTSIMGYDGGRLDSRNTRSLLEMREAVESLALRRVIEASDPAVFSRLRTIVETAERLAAAGDPADPQELAECYFDFHHTICVASGNTIAPLIFNAFKAPSVALWSHSVKALGMDESVGRLRKFMALMEAGDLAGALAHLGFVTGESSGT